MITLVFKSGVVLKVRANRFSRNGPVIQLYNGDKPVGSATEDDLSAYVWSIGQAKVQRDAKTNS